jgi:hypothetical protein
MNWPDQEKVPFSVAVGEKSVGDVIFSPNDKISVRNRTNFAWAAIRGAHKIPKKKKQDKGNTRGLIHQRSYAEVAAASA